MSAYPVAKPLTAAASIIVAGSILVTAAHAAAPAIRLSATNQVPRCVTASALNRFLADQNRSRGHTLAGRFRTIANYYQEHGTRHRVRWDYAFFQMALETNFLSFRRGNGKPGDVVPAQNNFAGLGTTGGGVPGDSYPDVSTGVLAQIQHLVVYSGERLENPVGHRTRLKRDVILQSVRKISQQRPVTFADLARRWAADRHYGRSIQRLANLFFENYCTVSFASARPLPKRPSGQPTRRTAAAQPPLPTKARRASRTQTQSVLAVRTRRQDLAPEKKPQALKASASRPILPASKLENVSSCEVQVASFGGERAILIESVDKGALKLTALNVHPGFEVAMAANFMQTYAPKGRTLGTFDTRQAAVARAHSICAKHRPNEQD